jgi:hypothetical protein
MIPGGHGVRRHLIRFWQSSRPAGMCSVDSSLCLKAVLVEAFRLRGAGLSFDSRVAGMVAVRSWLYDPPAAHVVVAASWLPCPMRRLVETTSSRA